MIVLVDVVMQGEPPFEERPPAGSPIVVELRDTTALDSDSQRVAARHATVEGVASSWLATTELVVDDDVDPRRDLTIWVRVAASGSDELAAGDWITTQSAPVDPTVDQQRTIAPVTHI